MVKEKFIYEKNKNDLDLKIKKEEARNKYIFKKSGITNKFKEIMEEFSEDQNLTCSSQFLNNAETQMLTLTKLGVKKPVMILASIKNSKLIHIMCVESGEVVEKSTTFNIKNPGEKERMLDVVTRHISKHSLPVRQNLN